MCSGIQPVNLFTSQNIRYTYKNKIYIHKKNSDQFCSENI